MLVGTHAFGALLNALGVRLPANYYTEDIDVARYRPIELATRPEGGILDILRQTGLPFAQVPELDSRKPSTSFKVRGQPLKVDLLVPGDDRYLSDPVPELGAHATGLPFFDYLLEESAQGIVLGRDHVIPVRIPTAARYCAHDRRLAARAHVGAEGRQGSRAVRGAGRRALGEIPGRSRGSRGAARAQGPQARGAERSTRRRFTGCEARRGAGLLPAAAERQLIGSRVDRALCA
jgi:hypothetical protein